VALVIVFREICDRRAFERHLNRFLNGGVSALTPLNFRPI
jgi:hypothetical protein